MEEISISRFKATCLAVLEKVRRTGRPVLVTRRGKPVAQVLPPPVSGRSLSWLGAMKGSGYIRGDVVGPASEETEWDALRG